MNGNISLNLSTFAYYECFHLCKKYQILLIFTLADVASSTKHFSGLRKTSNSMSNVNINFNDLAAYFSFVRGGAINSKLIFNRLYTKAVQKLTYNSSREKMKHFIRHARVIKINRKSLFCRIKFAIVKFQSNKILL
jgi:hypothetical protein